MQHALLLCCMLSLTMADFWTSPVIALAESGPLDSTISGQPLLGGLYYPVTGYTCSGTYCGTRLVQLATSSISPSTLPFNVDTATGSTLESVSSAALKSISCPLGAVVVRLTCSEANCGTIQLQCMRPTATTNAWRVNASFVSVTGSSGLIACPTSYVMVGLTCEANGCGTSILRCAPLQIRVCNPGYIYDLGLRCIGIACTPQMDPPRGTITSTNDNSYPSTSVLTCAYGYEVAGNGTRDCNTTGNWSGTTPTCVGVTCQLLPTVAHGSFALSNNYTYPTRATYTCAAGYVPSASDPIDCFFDGSWPDPTTCIGVRCSPLQDPPNGQIAVSNFYTYPANATLTCIPGYEVIGNRAAQCMPNGSWSASLGTCAGIMCDIIPPNPDHYIITLINGGRFPSTAFIECANGCVGPTVIRVCQPNGSWLDTVGQFLGASQHCPYIYCGVYNYNPSRAVWTSVVVSGNYSYPGTMTFNCGVGYTYYGPTYVITCRADGRWASVNNGCHPLNCAPLPAIARTSLLVTNAQQYPASATYTCVTGYLSDSREFTCRSDTSWTPAIPTNTFCIGVLCEPIAMHPDCNCSFSATNWDPKEGGYRYPSTVYMGCKLGFQTASGSTNRVCSPQGNWSNSNLMCVGIPCVVLTCPQVPCNVTYTNGRLYPSNATITCPLGYQPLGSSTTMCGTDGRWMDRMTCVGNPCDSVPTLVNGSRTLTNNGVYPSTVSTSCSPGYMLFGGAQFLTCDVYGKWSGPFPRCIGIPCSEANFNNSVQTFVSQNNYSYPDVVTTTCSPGYEISKNTFTCSSLGLYLAAPFQCTGVRCDAISTSYKYSIDISPAPGNGSAFFPSSVSFSCAPDHYTINNTAGICLPSKGWSIPPPLCLRFAIDDLSINGMAAMGLPKLTSVDSYFGNDLLTISGDFPNYAPANITYGPTRAIQFPCTLETHSTTVITCTTSLSYGKYCRVYISWDVSEVNALMLVSPDDLFITHPKPTLTQNTLIWLDAPPREIPTYLPPEASSTKGGDLMQFQGANFSEFPPGVVVVTFGVALDALDKYCTIQFNNDSMIECVTDPGESGPHMFVVTIYDVSSDLGKDGYTYPLGPIVKSVVGCTVVIRADNTTEATDCPTSGKVPITIIGINFIDPTAQGVPLVPSYMIGSTFGLAGAGLWTNSSIITTLPVGTGLGAVIVASAVGQSVAKTLITYASANITSITGCSCARNPSTCPPIPSGPIGCLRTGEQITIRGTNFGVRGASVFLVGVGICSNVVHDSLSPHTRLTCNLPPGFAAHQPLALLQQGGFLSFAVSPLDVSYVQCPPGQFQNGVSTVCGTCTPGRFSAQYGQSICEDCAYGAYSDSAGASSCTLAPEGSYVGITAANRSTLCSAGSFSLSTGAFQCKDCPPGTFAKDPGASKCTSCVPGQAQAIQGRTLCDSCQIGKFAQTPGSLVCKACDAGYIAQGQGATSCVACPVAHFSTNTSYCEKCSVGKYMNLQAASACLQCEAGYFVARQASEYCAPCPVGQFQSSKEGNQCSDCPAGTFVNTPGAALCFPCDIGTYTNSSGQSTCPDCVEGTYGPLRGLSACLKCQAGYYSAYSHSEACAPCAAGTAQNQTGKTQCEQCAPGKYAQDTAWKSCSECLPGSIAQNFRSKACTPCPQGTSSSEYAAIQCKECPTGQYGPAEGQTDCVECPTGKFSVTRRSTDCLTCQLGKFANDTGFTECEYCDPGTFADTGGLSQCRECEAGSFTSSKGYPLCDPCPVGTSVAVKGASVCDACIPGKYAPRPFAQSCDFCPRGSYQSYSRGSVCFLCEAGSSSDQPNETDVGALHCNPCQRGRYAPLLGMYACSPCEAGKYASVYASSTCSFCVEGTATALEGQLGCGDCPAGSYADVLGSTGCQLCLSGTFTDVVRTARCAPCQPGTHSNGTGSTECDDCAPGLYSSGSGAVDCAPCQLGYYTSLPRSAQCVKCPRGTSNNLYGQIECMDCDPGYYSAMAGAFECAPCQPGTFASIPRSISCGDCPPGRFIDVVASPNCSACPRGEYNGRQGSGNCLPCEPGTIASQEGAAACEPCLPGQFGNGRNQSTCENCRAGYFQSRAGSTKCEICDPGTFSDSGRPICTSCPGGTAAPFPGASHCRPCDENGFSANPPEDCICNANYFAPTRGVNDTASLRCQLCPKGIVCDQPGNTFETLRTEYGWWRSNEDSLDLYKCILPPHCLGGRNSTCGTARHGQLCATCLPGYEASGAGRTGDCTKCKDSSLSLVEAVFFCLLLFVGLGFLYYLVLRTQRNTARKLQNDWLSSKRSVDEFDASRDYSFATPMGRKATRTGRGISISSTDTSGSRTDRSFSNVDGSSERSGRSFLKADGSSGRSGRFFLKGDGSSGRAARSFSTNSVDSIDMAAVEKMHAPTIQERETERVHQARLDKKRRAGVSGKMRILISCLQIGTTLVSSINVPWPTLFRSFLDLLMFVNLDFVPWQSVGCVVSINYFVKLYMITAIPICAFLSLILFFVLPTWLWDRRSMADREVYQVRRNLARAKLWRLCLFTVFLVYPYVSSSIFRMYNCYLLEGVYWMKMDFDIKCYSDEWNAMIGPSIVMIFLYPFGIPFFTWVLLYRSRKNLDATSTQLELGFLYESYAIACWYFEMLVMLNKLFLVSFVGFFPDSAQMPVALGWLFGYICTVLLVRPYQYKSDDRLDLFATSLLMLLCLCGHVLNTQPQLDDTTDFIMSLVLITLFVLVFLTFNFMAIRVLVRKARLLLGSRFVRDFKRKKKEHGAFTLGQAQRALQRDPETDDVQMEPASPAWQK